ncbi:unnamed protein product [Adineta steineri]|uniref:Uncharacterized protein n=1 Tax=Adineta steineri TaxID=433720 RepID=A0A819WR60_9BILA|nr:unnamed protein product [Adineta steineri]
MCRFTWRCSYNMTDQHNEIRHEIYPKLEKYYSSKGYILQIVDMRWEVFESTSNEQLITDICFNETK